jgi:succinate dehydrogenase / fumarate reductase, membrane anchor subunit
MKRYMTDRKLAVGQGSAHAGTHHHWAMTVSAAGLTVLVPIWVYIFGITLGAPRDVVVATFARPFPAIVTGLILIVGMRHFAMGAATMIEDYSRGATRKWLIIGVNLLSALIAAVGLYALARIALQGF